MSLGNLELAVDGSEARAGRELELARRLAGQALRSTRDLAMGLRPTMLDDLGLEAALEWHARQHSKVYNVPVSIQVDAPLDRLSDAQRTCVYRIVQEALNNSGKYAQARNVEIAIAQSSGSVTLDIRDDGSGFETANNAGRGLGLLGMRERVAQIGGTLVIDSRQDCGTRISARLPLAVAES
jgi:signal transduction histidine kinase